MELSISSIEMFEQIAEQSPSSIVVTDIEGKILYVNRKFELITGYTRSEVIGQNPRVLKSGHQQPEVYAKFWEAISSGRVWKGEFLNKRKNGEHYWEFVTAFPIVDGDKILYYASIKEDIGKIKQLVSSLWKKNEQLQETVKILEETQLQMIQQEQMASIGQLAAGLAHEINNPLGFVGSNFKILLDYFENYRKIVHCVGDLVETEEIRQVQIQEIQKLEEMYRLAEFDYIESDIDDLVSDSKEGLTRIEEIVKSMRIFSRIDRMEAVEAYNVNEGIQNALTIIKSQLEGTASIRLTLEAQLPTINAIGSQINQVFLNLLVNAVQAIKMKDTTGTGEISIKTESIEESVQIEIEDNGVGISKENQLKIFQPFFTTKLVGVGTGLGLPIVYDIVTHKHHGSIELDSQEGLGTKFKVILPVKGAVTDAGEN